MMIDTVVFTCSMAVKLVLQTVRLRSMSWPTYYMVRMTTGRTPDKLPEACAGIIAHDNESLW